MPSKAEIEKLNAGLVLFLEGYQNRIDIAKKYKPHELGDYKNQIQNGINAILEALAFHRADNIPTDPAIIAAFRKFKATIDQYNAKYGKTFTIPPTIEYTDPDTGASATYTLESTLTFLATTHTRPIGDSPEMGGGAAAAHHHGANETHGGAGGVLTFHLDIPKLHLAGTVAHDGDGLAGKGGGCAVQ
jgi:hypothetical protein